MSPHAARPLVAFVGMLAAAFAITVATATTARAALPTEEVTFGSGTVDWGFANRWRCYVVGMISQGEIEVSDGAEKIPGTEASGSMCNLDPSGSEAVRFPVTEGYWDPVTEDLFIQTTGTVRFWGHSTLGGPPQLDTTFSDLTISAEGDTGVLTADVTGATQENPEEETYEDLPIVDLDLSGVTPADRADGIDWSEISATLSEEGTQAFGSYSAGEPFDPLTLAPVFGEPAPEPEPEPEPEPAIKAPEVKRIAAKRSTAKGIVSLASVRCPGTGPACRLIHKDRAAVKVGRRSYFAPVLAPAKVEGGETGRIQVRLPARVKKLIRGRPDARIKLKLKVERGGESTTRQLATKVTS